MLILALPLLTAACDLAQSLSPYRIEIQQGNYVTQGMVAQLKPGLTRDQVRFVLGTPLVSDIFHDERWDYVFLRQRANSRETEYRRIAVFFEDGKLKRIEGDIVAAAATGLTLRSSQSLAISPKDSPWLLCEGSSPRRNLSLASSRLVLASRRLTTG